jgi:hypothetical protein
MGRATSRTYGREWGSVGDEKSDGEVWPALEEAADDGLVEGADEGVLRK